MEKSQMKMLGIACLIVCAVCLFISFERYQSNANNVRAMSSSPLGGMMSVMTGQSQMKPGIPAATKYALLFAIISGVGGGVLMSKSQQDTNVEQSDPADP